MTPKQLQRQISQIIHGATRAQDRTITETERERIIEAAVWELLVLCAKNLATLSAWRDTR